MISLSPWHRRARALASSSALVASLLLPALLAGCGGGGSGSSSATVSPASASGTVTGFGSVYVDGQKLEDATALTVVENADGTTSTHALRLGEHVRVVHDGQGTASRITVDAAVTGSVTQVDTSTLAFKVAGQWVRANSDSAAGPVTVFGGGYTAFADLLAGDLVEVHGSPVYSSTRAAYEVQATRVEKQSDINAVRVMGKVAALDATGKSFAINGLVVQYAAATVAPTSSTLANSQTVVVWGGKNSVTTVAGSPTLSATRVAILGSSASSQLAAGSAQVSGVVSLYDASAGTLEIQGVKVNVASATVSPSGVTLGNGSYITVSGAVGSDGSLTASTVRIRQSDTVDDSARIRLSGAISTLTDTASFVVRGVPVDASSATFAASCSSVTLATGTFVNVVATAQAGTDVVLATSVGCVGASAVPTYAIREVRGTATTVDLNSLTFVVQTASGTQAVQWSSQTAFGGVTAATLSGVVVKVEGYVNSAGVLVAREIRVPNTGTVDAYDRSDDSSRGWGKYRSLRGGK